jgi:coenzyme F420-reducing hydrogenase gamma subunit
MSNAAADADVQLVTFLMDGEEYGVDVMQVKEVICLPDVTPAHNAKPYVEGMINLRGVILPIISLRKRLGLPQAEYDLDTRQGYTCMGSVTIDRCLSPCPLNGVPCTGCAGATMQVLTEPNRDIRTEIAEWMSRRTRMPREEIVAASERSAKSHYSYTMATSMIGKKPTFHIEKWVADEESDYQAGNLS